MYFGRKHVETEPSRLHTEGEKYYSSYEFDVFNINIIFILS